MNAHLQNGNAENRIRDIQEHTRKLINHAKARCPSAVYLENFPYALIQENHLTN